MQIPDEVRQCVVFLAYVGKDGQRKFAGTAFFCGVGAGANVFSYLVTAKHVIVMIKQLSVDGQVLIRINLGSGSFATRAAGVDHWRSHPDDTSVDVAALAWLPGAEFEFKLLPTEMFLTPERIKDEAVGIGDEVFMVGLFASHHGKQRNVPVVRIGNIACMPDERFPHALSGRHGAVANRLPRHSLQPFILSLIT